MSVTAETTRSRVQPSRAGLVVVVRHALPQAALGTVIGLTGGALLTRVVQRSLYGVQNFAATTIALAGVGMLLAGSCLIQAVAKPQSMACFP